jgi:hypothetical protein
MAMYVTKGPNYIKTVKPYAVSHEEYIGNPSLQSGKTAKAKAEETETKSGGAAKTADKAIKPKVKEIITGSNGVAPVYKVEKIVVDPKTAEKKAMEARIISDKSKTAMRARIIEARNAKKSK